VARFASKPDYIRTVIASPRAIWREGVVSVLSRDKDIVVEHRCSNILELSECVKKGKPRIVIIDQELLSISASNGIVSQLALVSNILLFLNDYDEEIELSALKLGVKGFILKNVNKSDLIKSIRTVNEGGFWVRRQIIETFIRDSLSLFDRFDSSRPVPFLSEREQNIVLLVCKGFRNKEIAKVLYLSEKTVKHYLTKIFKKLEVTKRKELGNLFRYTPPH
jgi:DNA-binding NarL/FixJ family response regulator